MRIKDSEANNRLYPTDHTARDSGDLAQYGTWLFPCVWCWLPSPPRINRIQLFCEFYYLIHTPFLSMVNKQILAVV